MSQIEITQFRVVVTESKSMKMRTLKMKVGKEFIRTLQDPMGKDHKTTYAFVKVTDIPFGEIPTEVNPRDQNLHSRVARQIATSFEENTDTFHILNRGMTITALSSKYDNKTGELELEINDRYGILDGLHSLRVVEKAVKACLEMPKEDWPSFMDGYVKIEVIEGVKGDMVIDLASSRNSSIAVRDYSLMNLEGGFDNIQKILNQAPFGDKIGYKENEDKPIHILDVISLLTAFHPSFIESETPPIISYASKGRCLELFRSNPASYEQLAPIMVRILELYDYLHLKVEPFYTELGGMSGISGKGADKKSEQVRIGKVLELKRIKEGFHLNFLNKEAFVKTSSGLLMPILGSLRGIVSYRASTTKWKMNPFEFVDEFGKKLLSASLQASLSLGRSPNLLGKSSQNWINLHNMVLAKYAKMTSRDED